MFEIVMQALCFLTALICGVVALFSLFFASVSCDNGKIFITCIAVFLVCIFVIGEIVKTADVIEVGPPIVEETRYEILGGNDTTRVSGSISGSLFHITGSISEDSFYKIYYPSVNSDGEEIAIPLTVKENQTEIVFLPDNTQNEYLLKLTTTQLYERKNKFIYGDEQWSETKSVRYKLYVKRETFNNKIVIDGN